MVSAIPTSSRLTTIAGIGGAILAAGAIVGISSLKYGFFLPLALAAVAYVVWSFPRPVVALTTIVALYAHLFEQSEDVSLLEMGFALYTYGYVTYWGIHTVFIRREKIIRGGADLLLAGFLALSVVSVVLLLVRNVSPEWWFREMLAISGLVLYFPARDILTTERAVRSVMIALLAVAVGIAFYNLISYRASTIAANYLWELWSGRKIFGGSLFASASVLLASVYLHTSGGLRKGGILLAFVIAALALAFTFSRGFWLGAILGVIVVFLLVDRVKRMRLAVTVTAGTLIAAAAIVIFAGNLGESIIRALAVRLSTSGNVVQDISLANRIVESRAALEMIRQSPVVGHGYGASFPHYNIITNITEHSIYVHNAYVHMLLKVGILGTGLFFGFWGMTAYRGIKRSRENRDSPAVGAMIRGSLGVFAGILFIATNSGILTDKMAILMIALGCAAMMADRTAEPQGGAPVRP